MVQWDNQDSRDNRVLRVSLEPLESRDQLEIVVQLERLDQSEVLEQPDK